MLMRDGPCWHHASVQSAGEMAAVIERVATAMAAEGYPQLDLFGMRLALEEAVANAVKHGNRGDPAKSVFVRDRVTPGQTLAEVEDQGAGFDPGRVPDPLAPENLERPCGRGLLLMRSYMTWVRYNDRGNAVSLCLARSFMVP